MIRQRAPWDARSTISKSAHVLERIGLALTGGACGLFVAAHIGRADIELIGSAASVLAMMIYGAAGFYLGIDLPLHHHTRADAIELSSAAGTFLAAVTAAISVSSIVLDETDHPASALLICLAWVIGTTLQVAAGIIARKRAASEPEQTSV
jgi:hypothetical protein